MAKKTGGGKNTGIVQRAGLVRASDSRVKIVGETEDVQTIRRHFSVWLRQLENVYLAVYKRPSKRQNGRVATIVNYRQCMAAAIMRVMELGKMPSARAMVEQWAKVENPPLEEMGMSEELRNELALLSASAT